MEKNVFVIIFCGLIRHKCDENDAIIKYIFIAIKSFQLNLVIDFKHDENAFINGMFVVVSV